MFLKCCVDHATQHLYFSLNQKKLKNNKTRILESKSDPTFVVASKKKDITQEIIKLIDSKIK